MCCFLALDTFRLWIRCRHLVWHLGLLSSFAKVSTRPRRRYPAQDPETKTCVFLAMALPLVLPCVAGAHLVPAFIVILLTMLAS